MGKFSIKPDYKISEKNAVEQVMLLVETYAIDVDSFEDKDEKRAAENALNRVSRYVRMGKLEIKAEPEFKVIQHLTSGETLNYGIYTGKNHAEMDAEDADKNYHRMFRLLGSICGLGDAAIKQLAGIDLKVAETLSVLFL